MFSAIIDRLFAIPDHIWAMTIILAGAGIAVSHLPHGYEVGSALVSAGLAMWRGNPKG